MVINPLLGLSGDPWQNGSTIPLTTQLLELPLMKLFMVILLRYLPCESTLVAVDRSLLA